MFFRKKKEIDKTVNLSFGTLGKFRVIEQIGSTRSYTPFRYSGKSSFLLVGFLVNPTDNSERYILLEAIRNKQLLKKGMMVKVVIGDTIAEIAYNEKPESIAKVGKSLIKERAKIQINDQLTDLICEHGISGVFLQHSEISEYRMVNEESMYYNSKYKGDTLPLQAAIFKALINPNSSTLASE